MATCPVKTDPEWKKLVEETSELEAYSLFIKNNYEIPSIEQANALKVSIEKYSESERNKLNRASKHLKDISKLKKNSLDLMVTKFNIYKNNVVYSEKIENLIKQYRDASIDESFILLHNYIRSEVDAFNRRIEASPLDAELYDKLLNFLGAYGLSKDLLKLYDNYEGTPLSHDENFEKNLKTLVADVEKLEGVYEKNARKAFAKRLAAQSTIVLYDYKERYRKEFRKNNEAPSSKVYPNKAARQKAIEKYKSDEALYIQQMLDENAEEITRKEEEYIENILETAPKDITAVSGTITDQRNYRNQLLQITSKLLDNADFRSNEKFIEARNELIPKFEQFKKDRKQKGFLITNQKQLYGEIIEKDAEGNTTGYYTRRFYSNYYDSLRTMWREFHELKDEGLDEEAMIVLKEWKKKHVKPELLSKSNMRIQFTNASHIKEEFVNRDFEKLRANETLWNMYNDLLEFNEASDALVPASAKLKYRIPGISKTMSEMITDNRKRDIAKKYAKDKVGIMSDDYQFGFDNEQDARVVRMLKGQSGKPFDNISIPFRVKLDQSEQSFDLAGMALSNRYFSINYAEKDMVKMDLEMIKDLVNRSTIKDYKNNKAVNVIVSGYKKITGQEQEQEQNEIKGEASNLYKALDSMLQDRLYGKHNIMKNFNIFGKTFNSHKMADALLGYSGNIMLMFNELGGIANFANGMTMNFFEAIKNVNFGKNDLRQASAKYFTPKAMAESIADMGALVPKSFTNVLGEKFLDSSIDFSPEINRLTKDSRFKRLANGGTFHYPNNIAEHVIQHTLMFAIMNNTKVMKDGKYVDKNGKETTRNDAATMDEMYTLNKKTGKLTFAEGFTIEGFKEFNKDAEAHIRRKIKDVVRDTQGQYDNKNKSAFERLAVGKLVIFLRKWIVPGAEREFLGIDKAFIHKDDLKYEDQFYSEAQQSVKEGNFTTLVRFLNMIRLDIGVLKKEVISTDWEKMSDFEKGNIKMALSKIAVMIGTVVMSKFLSALAKGIDDDDEELKRLTYSSAYIMRRLHGELTFFTPVSILNGEFLRILRSPSATLSSAENLSRLLEQVSSDIIDLEAEEYKTGRNKGKSKSVVLFRRSFDPLYKNKVDRDSKKSLDFLENGIYY